MYGKVFDPDVLHVRRDCSPVLLYVKLRGAISLPVNVLSHGRIEALCFTADVGYDKRVTPPLAEDAHVVALLHCGL